MQVRVRRLALAMIAVCAASACGDHGLTGPAREIAANESSRGGTDSNSEVVAILKRTEAVDAETVSGVIGPRGGHLELKRAGMRIDFAPGAVAMPTQITVTSVRGREVAYHFEPHGILFTAPVTIRQ